MCDKKIMAEKVLVSDSDGNNEGTILRPIVQLHWGLVRTSSDMDGVLPRIAKNEMSKYGGPRGPKLYHRGDAINFNNKITL